MQQLREGGIVWLPIVVVRIAERLSLLPYGAIFCFTPDAPYGAPPQMPRRGHELCHRAPFPSLLNPKFGVPAAVAYGHMSNHNWGVMKIYSPHARHQQRDWYSFQLQTLISSCPPPLSHAAHMPVVALYMAGH